METNYIIIATYCFIAVLWVLFIIRTKSTKNYMLFVSWTVFFPFTMIMFVCITTYFVIFEEFVEWLKRDF